MDFNNIQPADNYDSLKRQFHALKTILQSKEVEISVYRKRISEFKIERIVQLEAELESQKEMNAILTDELDHYKYRL